MLFYLFCFKLTAQQESEDVVYLKNGSIVKGDLVSLPNEPEKVKIESQGNTWVFDVNDVEKIVRDQKKKVKVQQEISTPQTTTYISPHLLLPSRKKTGYYNITDIGLLCGKDGYGYNSFSFTLNVINGYQFNANWATGVGVGVEAMDDGHMPVFIEGRYTLWDEDFSPFATFQAGYGFPFQGTADGGILLNPMIGFRNYYSSKSGLNFSLGYRFQKSTIDEYYHDFGGNMVHHYRETIYHRFNIRFGFIFN